MDVSGDGTSTASLTQSARDAAAALNIVINGLAIEGSATSTFITDFYRNNVITPSGFVVTAAGFDDFQRAVEQKLLIETGPGNQIPLPGTLALLGLGVVGLAAVRKRR